MNNSREGTDAATSTNTRREDKKATNTKVNPIINFQIGLIAALVAAFLIMELTSTKTVINTNPKKTASLPITETTMGPIREVPNSDPKPIVEKQQPKQPAKVDPNKPPKIIENDTPDHPELRKEPVQPVVSATTVDHAAPSNANPTSAKTTAVATPPTKVIMSSLSEVPLFPGCNSRMDNMERIACLNEKMARFIQRKFDTSLGNTIDNEKMVKISVTFTIGDDGYPKDILVKAPNQQLEKEAYKVISSLPKMTPGKIDQVPVNVTYALPIRFQINN